MSKNWQDFLAEIEALEARPWYQKLPGRVRWSIQHYGIEGFSRLGRNIVWAKQRIQRGYSDRDIWSFDHHLRQVTIDGLRSLADIAHGWPGEDYMTFEEYIQMIRDIADAFEMDMEASDAWRTLTEEEGAKLDKAWADFRKWYWSFWD